MLQIIYYLLIYKNCFKSMFIHNSQCCDTVLQIDWRKSVLE